MKLFKIKKLFICITFLAIILNTASCEKNEVGPRLLIVDNEGVEVSLEWNTGGSIDRAKDDIDMDLYLTSGKKTIASSETRDFEAVSLLRRDRDGAYDIKVHYGRIFRRGTFLFNIYGKAGRNRTLRFSGEVRPIQQGPSESAVLRIHKAGNEFRFVKLD